MLIKEGHLVLKNEEANVLDRMSLLKMDHEMPKERILRKERKNG